jgi:FKBP-type peptidyl-prolyl cis-trans isomerase (trigger factor)
MDNNQQSNQNSGTRPPTAGPIQQPSQPQGPRQRYSIQRKPDGSIVISINVPPVDVEKTRRVVMDELVKNVEVQGFRKGAAPRHLAEQKLNKQTVQEEVVRKTISDEYVAAVKQLNLKPIINPRVHIEPFDEGTLLSFTAETCEEPKVILGNYKDAVKRSSTPAQAPRPAAPQVQNTGSLQQGQATSLKGAQTPNQTQNQPQKPQEAQNRKLDQVLNTILNVTQIQIPKILVESEADRLLSQLLDELKRLGVSLDQYLASRQKNAEQLRAEYEERSLQDLKLEFVLRKIADDEKITVDQADVQKALAQIKDENERKQISQNPYLVGAIIRQQKTLDFLSKL